MRRRNFIALLGGMAVATLWPHTARAQQSNGMRRIAVLSSGNADEQIFKPGLAAFRQELQQLGWTDGRNVNIELRRGAGDIENIRKYATGIVALAPDVILAVAALT